MSSWFHWFAARGQRSRTGQSGHTEPGPSSELSRKRKHVVKNLSECVTKKQKKDEDLSRCPICLKKMKRTDDLTSTPCAHVFCTVCLLTAFEYSQSCPYCRLPVELNKLKSKEAEEQEEDELNEEASPETLETETELVESAREGSDGDDVSWRPENEEEDDNDEDEDDNDETEDGSVEDESEVQSDKQP